MVSEIQTALEDLERTHDSTTEQAASISDNYASGNNGQCVYKTVLAYLQKKGIVGSHLIIRDSGSEVYLQSTNGVTQYNRASLGEFTRRNLELFLYDVKSKTGRTLKEACLSLYHLVKPADPSPLPDFCYEEMGLKKNPNYPWTPIGTPKP